jgi:hypothetical protein
MAVHHELECSAIALGDFPAKILIRRLHRSQSRDASEQSKSARDRYYRFSTNLTKQPYDSFTQILAQFDTPALRL